MRAAIRGVVAAATLLTVSIIARGAADDAPKRADAVDPYPTEVALLSEQPKGWTYRKSPERLPLYFSDADKGGKPTCYAGCDSQWIPLFAPDNAKKLGEWTIVARKDGKHQWAYRNHPLYMRIHDSPDAPTGDGAEEGMWHLLPYFK